MIFSPARFPREKKIWKQIGREIFGEIRSQSRNYLSPDLVKKSTLKFSCFFFQQKNISEILVKYQTCYKKYSQLCVHVSFNENVVRFPMKTPVSDDLNAVTFPPLTAFLLVCFTSWTIGASMNVVETSTIALSFKSANPRSED